MLLSYSLVLSNAQKYTMATLLLASWFLFNSDGGASVTKSPPALNGIIQDLINAEMSAT